MDIGTKVNTPPGPTLTVLVAPPFNVVEADDDEDPVIEDEDEEVVDVDIVVED